MGFYTLRSHSSASNELSGLATWQVVVLATLVFWLSSSLIIDLIVMPGMYATGMMATPGFATAGYSMFWVFNRVEVLCAGLVLTGVFALCHRLHPGKIGMAAIAQAGMLMAIALTATYGLAPAMSGLGLHLSGFEPTEAIPAAMNSLHGGYFGLELLKFGIGVSLVVVCFRRLSGGSQLQGD